MSLTPALQQTSLGKPEIQFQWPRSPSPGGLESEPKWPVVRPDVTITYTSAALGDREQSNFRALRATKRAGDTRLHGKQILPLRGVQANARAGWQLQHDRVLTFA